MRLPLAFAALALGSAVGLALTPAGVNVAWAKPALAGCDAFMEKLRAEASDLQIDFTHALVVSRAKSGSNVFDITTKSEVDGTLTCHGDELARFEAHVAEPASARATTAFERLQLAALRAALGWDAGKIRALLRSMSSDVREYYAASRERGDVYVSGKTEEHVPGGVSLGLIQTDVDRAFVIIGSEE
jgi:hypothetical protein